MRPTQVYYHASAAETADSDSGSLAVAGLLRVEIDIQITALTGTNPGITFFWDRLGQDGSTWFNVWTSASQTSTGALIMDIGPGLTTAKSVGQVGRLRWTRQGTASPTATFVASVNGT